MPIIRNDAWQLILLLIALPLQYFIVQYYGSTSHSRDYEFNSVLSQLTTLKTEYFEWKSWRNWCSRLWMKMNLPHRNFDESEDNYGESPAIEVMKYKDENGYFGTSSEPRSPKPPFVKYRIGQVVKHKRFGYRGVIIGWDKEARAPDSWLKDMHGTNKHWRRQPNYAILVDTRDRSVPQMTYVPEENFEIVTNVKIVHSSLDDYFEGYDGAQYLPRPWMKTVYPYD